MAGAAAFQAGFFRPQGEPRSRARLGFGCRSDPRLGQDLQPGPAPPARKGRRAARSSHRTEALVQNEPEVAPKSPLGGNYLLWSWDQSMVSGNPHYRSKRLNSNKNFTRLRPIERPERHTSG